MKAGILKTIIFALIFGILSGIVVTVALSVFIPKFYPEWAGSFVCPGRIEYVTFKQTYYCYTAPNASFDLGGAMYWAVFNRFILPAVAVCFLFALGFVKLGEFLWQRRDAAGF
jgi:hypothetical protein